jgi:MazG family protein
MTKSSPLPQNDLDGLLDLMARLRSPDGGCPWDLEQTFATIAPHTIEEAYEVADAIEHGDMEHLKDELGDLLFQVVFYAQMAKEQGAFDFHAIAAAITEKMIRRHPHVFGTQVGIDDAQAQVDNWEALKADERKTKAEGTKSDQPTGALADVSRGFPALMRAHKLQKRAARVGFDWPDVAPVFDKFREEVSELEAEIEKRDERAIEHEIGDLLFTCVNLARKLGVDSEVALGRANGRFESRFGFIEQSLWAQGQTVEGTALDELDRLWCEAKTAQSADRQNADKGPKDQ